MPRQCTKVIFLPEMTPCGPVPRFPTQDSQLKTRQYAPRERGSVPEPTAGTCKYRNTLRPPKTWADGERQWGEASCMCQPWQGAIGPLHGRDRHVHIHGHVHGGQSGTGTGEAPSPAGGKPGTPCSLLLEEKTRRHRVRAK